MLLYRRRHLPVQLPDHPDGTPGGVKCYEVPSATAQDGSFTILRKPKELEVALAEAAAAGYPVKCRYTPEEAAALDENDPALYICVTLPRNVDELLLTLSRMQQGGTDAQRSWRADDGSVHRQFFR
jgi:hypothetical protein